MNDEISLFWMFSWTQLWWWEDGVHLLGVLKVWWLFWKGFGVNRGRYVFEFCICGHSRWSLRFLFKFFVFAELWGFNFVLVLILDREVCFFIGIGGNPQTSVELCLYWCL